MTRVLLADSESDSIRTMKAWLKSYFPDIRSVRSITESSRMSVKDFIRTNRINLVIADVRFFGAGSYAMVQEIHESFSDLTFVLYGSLHDGEYLQEVMEQGVAEYLYKPLKAADFQRAVESALQRLVLYRQQREEEDQLIDSYRQQIFFFENQFLNQLVRGKIQNEEEIRRSFDYFNMEYAHGYQVLIFCIDHFRDAAAVMEDQQKHLQVYRIYRILQKALKNPRNKAFIIEFNAVGVLMDGDILDNAIHFCEEVKEEIYRQTKADITAGIGRTYEEMSEIAMSYKEAKAAIRYRFHLGYDSVIPIHFVEPMNRITYRYPLEKENKLVHAVVIGEYDCAVRLLRDLLDSLRACEPLPDKLLSKIIMDILISINRYATEVGLPILNRFTQFFPASRILELNEIDQAEMYLESAIRDFCQFTIELQNEHNEELHAKAKEYVDVHYYESFSMPRIAAVLGTTPEYLNRVFHSKEGRNLFDYVVSIRLQEAKRLMRETDFDDNMIAVKVGYDDGRHFRSVFRQSEGMSAKEYRSKYSLYAPVIQLPQGVHHL